MTIQELMLLCESISDDISQAAHDNQGVWHMPGSSLWAAVIEELEELGHSAFLVTREHAPELIESPGEFALSFPETESLHQGMKASSFMEHWHIDGHCLGVHKWAVWHGGPNSGSFQPFWEWVGDTADIRKKMREARRPDLEAAANRMLDQVREGV